MLKPHFTFRSGAVVSLKDLQFVGYYTTQGTVICSFAECPGAVAVDCTQADAEALQQAFREFLDSVIEIIPPKTERH